MSPVSRGRKKKRFTKGTGKGRAGSKRTVSTYGAPPSMTDGLDSPFAVFERMIGARERPEWFDRSITRVLENAGSLTAARGPLELDQYTAELLGAELHAAISEGGKGLWFDWWLAELVAATTDRVKEEADRDGWRPPLLLLHGLAALASPGLRSEIPLRDAATWVPRSPAEQVPDWLTEVSEIQTTGEVFRMRDAYGTRFAVIAGFRYPRSGRRSVYLFDIDTSGLVELAGAGVFDDLEQAALAWRGAVGESADSVRPQPVTVAEDLLCLSHLDRDERAVTGEESPNVMDNWFRAERRLHDLAAALKERGIPLPRGTSLYHDLDISVLAQPFTAWYADSHGRAPNSEAVAALADEWMEGTLPESWFAVSPRRVEFQLALIGDWIDDPITYAAKALMPEWVRWLAQRAHLPEHLARQVLASAGAR